MIYLEFSDLFGVLNIKMNNVLLLFDVFWFDYIFTEQMAPNNTDWSGKV